MKPKAMAEAFIELVDAASYLSTDCDELFYTFEKGNGGTWYVCRECGADARMFTAMEHQEGCPIDAFEKALRKVKGGN